MMVYFRERIDQKLVNDINQKMVKNLTETEEESQAQKKTNQEKSSQEKIKES